MTNTLRGTLAQLAASCALAVGALSHEDLLQMKRAGLSDAVIAQAVQDGGGQLGSSPAALIHLKKAGLGDSVISAILSAGKQGAHGESQPSSLPDEVGVYYTAKGALVSIEPELINSRTSGVLKYALTSGIMKARVKGAVEGPRSPLRLSGAADFLIRVAEGVGITEYQLVRMEARSSRREFEVARIGVANASTGTTPHQVQFKYTKIAPRTYRITCAGLPTGEYGFLPPGAMTSASGGSMGKAYTFGLE